MQYLPFFRSKTPANPPTPGLALTSCIKLVQEKLTPQRMATHGVVFHINTETIAQIEQAQDQEIRLDLEPSFLTKWRHYAMFDPQNQLQSGLSFTTYYHRADNTEVAVLRSVILLDGNVFEQLQQDLLRNSELALQVTNAHYWLIEQLLSYLPLKLQGKSINWASWLIAALIVLVSVILSIKSFMTHPWLLILIPVVWVLLQWGIRILLQLSLSRLQSWLLKQTLWGWFSRSQKDQNMALTWLEKL